MSFWRKNVDWRTIFYVRDIAIQTNGCKDWQESLSIRLFRASFLRKLNRKVNSQRKRVKNRKHSRWWLSRSCRRCFLMEVMLIIQLLRHWQLNCWIWFYRDCRSSERRSKRIWLKAKGWFQVHFWNIRLVRLFSGLRKVWIEWLISSKSSWRRPKNGWILSLGQTKWIFQGFIVFFIMITFCQKDGHQWSHWNGMR